MDRNTTLGLVLIAGIVITWMTFFGGPSDDAANKDKGVPKDSTSLQAVQNAPKLGTPATNDSAALIPVGMPDSVFASMDDSSKAALFQAEKVKKHGQFAGLMEGQDRQIRVETDKYSLSIGTRGAFIRDFRLNDFKTHDSLPLPIQLDDAGNRFFLNFKQADPNVSLPIVETDKIYFQLMQPDSVFKITGSATKEVVFRAQVDDRRYFEFAYIFKGDAYDYGFELRQKGMDQVISGQYVTVQWESFIPKTESAMIKMREKAAIYYHSSGSVEWMNPRSENGEVNEDAIAVDWVSFHSQFFSHTILTAEETGKLDNLRLFQADPVGPDPEDPNSGEKVKYMQMNFSTSFAQAPEGVQKLQFFAGPLDFSLLKKYDRDMTQQIELGWGPLKWINRFVVIPLFNFLEGFIPSYGIIILILAIFIKLVLYPLSYRTQVSTTRMRVVNSMPEIKALEEKYKDNATKLQQEKMVIYRQMGVSLFGGCWPMLLSYPFLIAFFFFFPNAIELRQQSFLWAHDLSTYDSILELGFNIPFYGDHVSLFTLLMTLSIYAFTWISQQNQAQMQTNPVMKWMPYVMPIIFLGFLNSYSAGLSWYYLISNVLSILQTFIIKRFIDEKQLLEKMREAAKAKKDTGKSKSRLERWTESQQQKQREVQKSRNQSGKGGGR